jgi:hypothetical protein
VRLQERAPGLLAERNHSFARGFVIPRKATMAIG